MRYTDYGLVIGLDELRKILDRAENEEKHGSMCGTLCITYGNKPEILQYCQYAECWPNRYTNGAEDWRKS